MRLGYKLMSEELGPRELVANAVRAEELGFQLAAISDHYFPWLEDEGHAPFIWSVLGAIATATERIELMTAVTCPTFRYHPAIVAQAAATVSVMAGRRFRLGLGSGEQLNEHVIGGGWPAPAARQERLEEAIDLIRLLFSGETCSHRGEYFELDRARIFDLPDEPPPIVVAAGGPRAARIAGEKADAALDTMHRYARWTKLDWNVLAELATPRAFDAASQSVKRSDLREIPHGPDLETYVDAIEPYLDAGFDELILHQIGPEQDGFLQFFASELGPALRARGEARASAGNSSSPPRRHS